MRQGRGRDDVLVVVLVHGHQAIAQVLSVNGGCRAHAPDVGEFRLQPLLLRVVIDHDQGGDVCRRQRIHNLVGGGALVIDEYRPLVDAQV